jgi:large subunit ribosomal protein L10
VDRAQKEATVAGLNQTLGEVNLVVVTQQSGLTVYESMMLRRKVREAGAGFKVTKNRLTRLALEGTKFQALQSLMTGPTALAFSEDPVAAAKVCVEFAKQNEKLTIIGGALGEQLPGPGQAAVARRVARQARRPGAGPGHQGGGRPAGAGRPAGPSV